jgi:sterol desaturase/sphingolipid hydroxylase (fatty acid hydroxylase superfamily)
MDLLVRTIPIAIVGGSYPAWALFAFFDGMWGYYIHSSVRLSYGPLNYLIVTPQNHRLHHSIEPEHIDRNFGERLAIWDWIFGTLYKDFSVYPDTGVRQCERIEEQSARPVALCKSWFVQFLYPFLRIAEDAKRWAGWTGFVR